MDGTFEITNDKTAQWALNKIREARAERDRLAELAQSEIERLTAFINDLCEKCDRDTAYLTDALRRYFEIVTPKETKTKASYKLIGGALTFKKPKPTFDYDVSTLIEALRGTEYVEAVETLHWGAYKKRLEVVDGKAVDTATGEVVDGVTISETPGEFVVEVDV